MNCMARAVMRLPVLRALTGAGVATEVPARSLWMRAAPLAVAPRLDVAPMSAPLLGAPLTTRSIHTKGERELVEFLTEEILAEKKTQKVKTIPAEVDGFKVKLDGAEVTLTKTNNNETISINFNVNHTVDSDSSDEDISSEKQEFAEMRSKPQFEVDIVRGKTTLSFTCSFVEDSQPVQDGDGYNDIFGIDEVTMYEGEWNDKTYAIAGDVLDGYLYDLLMNYLEEKGVSNEFAEKLSDFSTAYEHSAYICLLESLSKFTGASK